MAALRVFFVLVTVLCAFPAQAMGKKSPNLAGADVFIKEQRYTEAMDLLIKEAWETSDNFDSAQERIARILRLTQTYNDLANILMDTARDNPKDLDKILAISNKLREIEAAARSDKTRNVMNQIFISARFSRYGRDLNRIMSEARTLLDNGELGAALQKYQSGFGLYADEFRQARVGEEIETATRKNLQTLTANTAALARTAQTLRNAAAQIARTGNNAGAKSGLRSVFNQISPELDSLVAIKKAAEDMDDYFLKEGEALTNAGVNTNATSHLYVLSFLLNGREYQQVREGFLGVYDAYWRLIYPAAEAKYRAALEDAHNQILTELSAQNWEGAHAAAQNGQDIADAFEALFQKYSAFTSGDKGTRLTVFDATVPFDMAELYANSRALAKAIRYDNSAAEAGAAHTAFNARQSAAKPANETPDAETLKAEAAGHSELAAIGNALELNINAVRADLAFLGRMEPDMNVAEGREALVTAQTAMLNISSSILKDEQSNVARYYEANLKALNTAAGAFQKTKSEADALMRGEKKTNEAGEVYTTHHPAEALALFESINAPLAAAQTEAEKLAAALENEPARIPRNKNFKQIQTDISSALETLRNLREQTSAQTEDARKLAGDADAFRREGNANLARAREALRTQNFELAREMAERAGEAYNTSLVIQESNTLRKIWDEQLVPLNAEIARREYEVVIGEVRGLVTRARNLYFSGEYENAEELLIRASNRWAAVSMTPETEVAYWLSLARGALSLQSGRVIPVTSALYNSMSQLLNAAQKNYNDGAALVNNGKYTEGERSLRQAKKQINEVRMVFPINHDAGILDLRIDQVLDKENFERIFAARLQTAVTQTKQGSREAYADMQNLAEIQPEYPGIQRALQQAEIDIGLRAPPADHSVTTRAMELARRADAMTNAPSQRAQALELVNESLRLNPNSVYAMGVKDRLQLIMARQNVTVIDRAAEQEYIRAVSELQHGNTIIAMSIVQRLLQNPANRNSVKINDLRRRIEAAL